jgi:hypothetical protein
MSLSDVLREHYGIESIHLVLPIDQRSVTLPDGSKVELPERIKFTLFVVKRDGDLRQCVDTNENEFRVVASI